MHTQSLSYCQVLEPHSNEKKTPTVSNEKKTTPKVKKIYAHTDMMCFHKIRRTSRLLKGCKWWFFPKSDWNLIFFLLLYERYACFWNYSPPWRTENTFLRFTLKGGEGEGGRQRTALWLAIAEPSKEKQSERRTDDRHQFDVAIV